jgi:predicted GNAT family acetyltransferase
MQVRHASDPDTFLAVAGDFLAAREAEHNLIYGILSSLRESPEAYSGPAYLGSVHDDDGRVVAAAIQTPPFRLVLSEIDDPAAVAALARDTLDRDLPGVMGAIGTVETFVDARVAAGGPAATLTDTEQVYRLSAVRPPRPVTGSRRIATETDRDLVRTFLEGFMLDAFGRADLAEVESMTDRWLARRARELWLWQDGDETTSLCGIGGPTPDGIRIGPVYTPPAARGRGYASNLVAEVSQAALASGRRFCFLLTDAANPTSNHIYREIGYEHVRDLHIYEFERTSRSGPSPSR